jgi:hypothetical protein
MTLSHVYIWANRPSLQGARAVTQQNEHGFSSVSADLKTYLQVLRSVFC